MDNRSRNIADFETHRRMDADEKNAKLRRDARNWWLVIVIVLCVAGFVFGEVLRHMAARVWR